MSSHGVAASVRAAFDRTDKVQVAIDLDVAFHEAAVVASGNAVIQIMFGSIRDLARGMAPAPAYRWLEARREGPIVDRSQKGNSWERSGPVHRTRILIAEAAPAASMVNALVTSSSANTWVTIGATSTEPSARSSTA